MTWKIAAKEFLSNLLTFRFSVGMILLISLSILFSSILINDYRQNLEEYSKRAAESTEELNQIKVFQNLNPSVHKAPEVLSLFSKGIEEHVAKSVRVSVFDVPVLSGTGTTKNPLLPVFPVLDVVLIFKLVVVVLVLLLSYDAISGEKENGTLRLMLANSIPRYQIITGKFLGGMLTLAIPVASGFLITCLMLELSPSVKLGGGEWLRIGLMLFLTLLMVGIFFNLGLFISALTKKSSDTLMLLLLILVFFLLIIPNSSSYLATRIKPTENRAKINAQIQDIQNRLNEKIREIRRQNPEEPGRIYIQSDGMDPTGSFMYYGTKAEVERRLILNPLVGLLRIDYARQIGELNRQYLESLVSQKKWNEWLSRISPISFYENLMSTLSRTDFFNFQNFIRSAADYRQKLVGYFQAENIFSSIRFFGTMKMEDVFEINENREYGPYFMKFADRNPDSLDLSQLPQYKPSEENALEIFKKLLPELLALLGMGTLFFFGAFVALVKYDVR